MAVAALVFTGTPPALASPTTVSVSSGALTVTTPSVNDFAVVILDGEAQTAHTPLETFWVTDARGSGQGWKVKLQATQFREWSGTEYPPGGKTLPYGSLSLSGISVSPSDTGSVGPVVVQGPHPLDGATVTLAVAAADTGMGRFLFDPSELTVAVPAHAYARAYRSELSISVASGP